MTSLLQSIHQIGDNFNSHMEYFTFHHPFLVFLMMFVGMPIITLIAVIVCTTLLVMPISLILGWV